MNNSKKPVWQPDADLVAETNLTRFEQLLAKRNEVEFETYGELHRWSVENPEDFWTAVWDFTDVQSHAPWHAVLENPSQMPGARWFTGSELNFAENLLKYSSSKPALIFRGENGNRREVSYADLGGQVARVAKSLRAEGVVAGDRVAGFLPNIPETVIAMLAASSIGAVWSSCSPDFGINGVLDRFGQIRPKVLFTADGYFYNGKTIGSLAAVSSVVDKLPSVRRVVVVPFVSEEPDVSGLKNAVTWTGFSCADAPLEFASLPFDHPLYIMYSSGTTGTPKCIVHGAGGTLLQHLKEHVLHTDLRCDDVLFYFTTCGWMMWNWLVSGLATGATLVLYDGSPFAPDASGLWRMAEEEGVTVFGTSAKYLSAVEKAGFKPGAEYNLSALRAILSTGSPLAPASYDFVYEHIKTDVQLASISGGTDIISCFALGCPTLPVYRGELQCPGLGMAVEIYDDSGASLERGKGELVCTRPFPSMPVGFWDDPDDRRYHASYFERFPNVWAHGDYAELTEHGGVIIHGRSDAVLNPGGVRIGTAEIYRQVEKLDEVVESIAVGQTWEDDVRVVLFVVLAADVRLDDRLRDRIRQTVRQNATPRHVPAKIIGVPEIPRTISGKIVELAVRSVIHDEPVKNTDALANPEALEHFRDLPELLEP